MIPNQTEKGAPPKDDRPAPQGTSKDSQQTPSEAPVRYNDWASI